MYYLGLLADGDGMSRGGGSRKGFLVWLEDMIDVSMKHAPATTRMLLERKLKDAETNAEPVMVPIGTVTGRVIAPAGTEKPVPPPGKVLKEGEQP